MNMQNDGKTEYANSGNTTDGGETLYVRGGNAIEENQTEYVGKECSEKIDSEKQRKEDSADNEPIEEEKQETEAYFLPINTILLKRYRIDGVLGQGGFGITYLGWDITLNASVAIKEFFPSGLATRSVSIGRTTQVVPIISSRKEEDFRDGVRRVLDEARKMARFRNTPGIVGVYDFFEANNTAYIVMEYVDGCTLDKFYKEKQIDDISLFNRLVPVMDALQALHKEGILHRDISPDNIMVDKEENFKLLDFGAARGYQEGPSASMSVILKRNYAPIEQFSTKGNQGPWTDVYALGATIYSLLTGKNVPESVDRLIEDDIVDIRELDDSLSDKQAAAIMKALAVHKEDRWESVEEFKNALICDTRRNETGKNDDFKELKTVEKSEKKKGVLIVCTLLIILAIIAFSVRESVKNTNRKESVTTETSEKEISSNESTFEKDDLSIELVGAEIDKYSSERLHLLLRFNNPNDTCSVIIDSLSINGVEVSGFEKIEGVLGETESTKEIKVDYPNVIAQQVGEYISSMDVQYRYEGEYDVERYCSKSGYSYLIITAEKPDIDNSEVDSSNTEVLIQDNQNSSAEESGDNENQTGDFYKVTEYNKQPDYSKIYSGDLNVDYSNLPSNLDVHLFPTEHGEICGFITNVSDQIIPDMGIQLNYKNKKGETIKTDRDGHDVVLPGYTVVSRFDCPKEFSNITLEFTWGSAPGWVNHSEYVHIETNIGENNIILEITNNWDNKISEIEYDVILYKKDRIVEILYPQDVIGVEPGITVTKEESTWGQEFDRYEVYLNQAHTF